MPYRETALTRSGKKCRLPSPTAIRRVSCSRTTRSLPQSLLVKSRLGLRERFTGVRSLAKNTEQDFNAAAIASFDLPAVSGGSLARQLPLLQLNRNHGPDP